MKLVTRKKKNTSLEDSRLYETYSPEEKKVDMMWGFITMIETIQDGNTRFSFDDIINQWFKIAFGRQLPVNPQKHHIPQICAGLFLKSARSLKLVPPRGFMPLFKEIMDDKFLTYTENQVKKITTKLSEFILTEVNTSKGE